MAILQIGANKSGNLWVWRTIEEILRLSGVEHKSFIQNQPVYDVAKHWDLAFSGQAGIDCIDIGQATSFCSIYPVYRYPVEDIKLYVESCSHVWSHSPFKPYSEEVLPLFSKIVYIVRDPRDALLSMHKMNNSPFKRKFYDAPALNINPPVNLAAWTKHVGGYLLRKTELNIYFLFYERLLENFDEELELLVKYLGYSSSSKLIETVRESVHFRKMKEADPHHVNKGKRGGWLEVLPRDQQVELTRLAEPMLRFLNYPLNIDDYNKGTLPSVPSDEILSREVKRIINISV